MRRSQAKHSTGQDQRDAAFPYVHWALPSDPLAVSFLHPQFVLLLSNPGETDIVTDYQPDSDSKRFGIRDIEFLELNFALPHLPQEILNKIDRDLLAGAAAISEAERRKAGIVADRQRPAFDNAVDGPKAAVVDCRLAPVR